MIGTAAAVGIGLTAAGTGASFYQASQQRKKASEAEAAAAKSMQEARKRLEVNFYEGLGINKEPYNIARDQSAVTATNLIQAGIESERGAGAVAGRVQMAQNENNREIASAMGTEMNNLNKLVATEDARLNNVGLNLDLASVQGAQLAAANYDNMANNSLTQGLTGIASLGGQITKAAPLYAKTKVPTGTNAMGEPLATNTQISQAEQAYNQAISTGAIDPKFMANGKPLPYAEAFKLFSGGSGMTEAGFYDYLSSTNKDIGLKNYQFPVYDNDFSGVTY